MAASFPTSYDTLTNPTAGSLLTSPSHAGQHTDANDIIEAIEQRVGLSGSSFPGSPSSGQFFHRTDRRLDYYYDGTRWVTTHLYEVSTGNTPPAAALSVSGTGQMIAPAAGVYDLWLDDFQASFFVQGGGSALSASHKWVVTLVKNPASTTIATVNIDSGSSAVWRTSGQVSIAALLGTTNFEFDVVATKTGTPGNLYILTSVTYRLVG